MVGTSVQSCSSEPSGTQWVMPSHLNLNGIDQNWHWNWLSTVGVPWTTSRTVPWTTALFLLFQSVYGYRKREKKMNLKTIQMKQTFLAPIEAPCWFRPAKTASGVLGCIASIILTNKLFSKKIWFPKKWCRNSVKRLQNKDVCFLYWLNNLTVYWCVKSPSAVSTCRQGGYFTTPSSYHLHYVYWD